MIFVLYILVLGMQHYQRYHQLVKAMIDLTNSDIVPS
jgi:hypothetical protein